MIALGTYKGRGVLGSEDFSVSASGGEVISVELDVHVSDQSTVRVRTFLAFSGKAEPFSLERLRALGWRGTDITRLTNIDANEVDVLVKEEEYQGKRKTVVEIQTPRKSKPLGSIEKIAFARRMRDLAAANPPTDADGKPLPLDPDPPTSAGTDDLEEVPF